MAQRTAKTKKSIKESKPMSAKPKEYQPPIIQAMVFNDSIIEECKKFHCDYACALLDLLNAKQQVLRLKFAKEQLVAQLDTSIRKNTQEKLTEAAVKNRIENDGEFYKASIELMEAEFDEMYRKTIVEAFITKGRMIDNLMSINK